MTNQIMKTYHKIIVCCTLSFYISIAHLLHNLYLQYDMHMVKAVMYIMNSLKKLIQKKHLVYINIRLHSITFSVGFQFQMIVFKFIASLGFQFFYQLVQIELFQMKSFNFSFFILDMSFNVSLEIEWNLYYSFKSIVMCSYIP